MNTNIANKSVSAWWCLYVISTASATFDGQFIKKLNNTEAGLKNSVAYKKSRVSSYIENSCKKRKESH